MEAPQPAQPVAVTATRRQMKNSRNWLVCSKKKFRKPNVPANANPSSVPASVVPSQERARPAAAAPSPPSPVRARPPSEPQLPRADAEISTPDDNLEQQLASLLGRAIKD